MSSTPRRLMLAGLTVAFAVVGGCKARREAVTTYHYDNLRTGWNRHEEKLKYKNVGSPKFGLRHTVALDDQVDAQPLVVPHVRITGGPKPGEHEVVYVATEGNTVSAIDATNGDVLLAANFGNPVPMPLGCGNNGPNVGINGTPVIDLENHTLYVIVYTLIAGAPTYYLHALDLGNLTDKMPAVLVSGSHTLNNGSTFHFNATYQRQRPGLLLAHGNVYAGFGSFCDWGGTNSRGWVLGWNASTLAPLPGNHLNDAMATSPDSFFLSSVWMSGFGLAADQHGDVYFVTGNSDTTGGGTTTYDGVNNIQESVVKLSSDLTTVLSIFTPSNVGPLDQGDVDYGSGGAMLLPEQEGAVKYSLAAAGKDGRLFVLDRSNLGGYTAGGPDKYVALVQIGDCWCGPSYFRHHIVSSGGSNVITWKVSTSPSFTLTKEGTSASVGGGQDGGFFTSVSSDEDDDPIIWAVSRPDNPSPATITLYAFKGRPTGTALATLFSGPAGTWPNTGGNSNTVPVVANGRVYVASNKQLSIFGLN